MREAGTDYNWHDHAARISSAATTENQMTGPRLHVHTSHQTLRWADMDTLGHVNNTVYFRYMEQARVEWLYAQAQMGDGKDAFRSSVSVNASCNFLLPLVYPGAIEVRMYLGNPGRTSMGSYYEIYAQGTLHADGAAKIVWIDATSGRPTPLPEHLATPLRNLG